MRTPTFEKKIKNQKKPMLLFRLVLSEILSRRCRLLRTRSDPAKKEENFRPKLRFSCFSGEKFDTILSRRSRLSRTSRAPSRLIRPRPIDCDAGSQQTVKIFPRFLGSNTVKNKFFQKVRHLVTIYTPKEAHSRIFLNGGSCFARQMLAKKIAFLGVASL